MIPEDQVNESLISIEPMIWSILQSYSGLSKEDRQDIKQDVMIYLWNHVMPQYDASKGAKFSSFAYRCAINFINRKLYSTGRRKIIFTRTIDAYRDQINNKAEGVSGIVHNKMRVIHEMVLKDESILKPKEKAVILIIIDNPDITQKEIAEIMGYRHPSAISMMMSRIRKKIKKYMSSSDV